MTWATPGITESCIAPFPLFYSGSLGFLINFTLKLFQSNVWQKVSFPLRNSEFLKGSLVILGYYKLLSTSCTFKNSLSWQLTNWIMPSCTRCWKAKTVFCFFLILLCRVQMCLLNTFNSLLCSFQPQNHTSSLHHRSWGDEKGKQSFFWVHYLYMWWAMNFPDFWNDDILNRSLTSKYDKWNCLKM